MDKVILALDQGTTSSRAIVFDRDGRVVAAAQQEFPQILPGPGAGRARSRGDLVLATRRGAGGDWPGRRLPAADIAAIGRDQPARDDHPLGPRTPAGRWPTPSSGRAASAPPICDRLKADGLERPFARRPAWCWTPISPAPRSSTCWTRTTGCARRAERGEILFGTVDTWLIWRLTGGRRHVTDYSNASRTLLFNIHTLDWDDELLRDPRTSRGRCCRRCGRRARSTARRPTSGSAARSRLPAIAGDQQAATFGQACFEPGSAKNTYGTGCFLLMNTGHAAGRLAEQAADHDRLGPRRARSTYCLEGSVFIAGAVVQWLRDGLGLIGSSADVEPLARQRAGLAAACTSCRPLSGLGRRTGTRTPAARSSASPAARPPATSPGRPWSRWPTRPATCWRPCRRTPACRLTRLKVDGGASVNDLLMQFQADMLGVPVRRPVVAETTALGAAYLAGLAVGYWHDTGDIERNWALGSRVSSGLGGRPSARPGTPGGARRCGGRSIGPSMRLRLRSRVGRRHRPGTVRSMVGVGRRAPPIRLFCTAGCDFAASTLSLGWFSGATRGSRNRQTPTHVSRSSSVAGILSASLTSFRVFAPSASSRLAGSYARLFIGILGIVSKGRFGAECSLTFLEPCVAWERIA